jgi:hypothetical protein
MDPPRDQLYRMYVSYNSERTLGRGKEPGDRIGVRYMLNAVDMTVTQARAEFADLVNRVAYTG